ncbi:hypothetical protein C2R22_15455 [Salinigranum rubrum]|uniref:Uncharacterized protein n=1 Tax=Salinigranum rubrum TaxID=755307 RepID=A0A2I8VLP9_9EURY|nr:hypothetical protein C2R22_15455 [Salinigranum rubrum]
MNTYTGCPGTGRPSAVRSRPEIASDSSAACLPSTVIEVRVGPTVIGVVVRFGASARFSKGYATESCWAPLSTAAGSVPSNRNAPRSSDVTCPTTTSSTLTLRGTPAAGWRLTATVPETTTRSPNLALVVASSIASVGVFCLMTAEAVVCEPR